MKHCERKAILLLIVTIFAASLIPASAGVTEKFRDVPETSPYYNAVSYISENNYTNGIGNGLYGVDLNTTLKQAMIFTIRAFGDDDMKSKAEQSAYDIAVMAKEFDSRGWLTFDGDPAAVVGSSQISRHYFYDMVLRAKGYSIYSDCFFETQRKDVEGNVFSGPLRLANQLGLTDDAHSMNKVSRGEAAQVIYLLKTKELPAQEIPVAATKIQRLTCEFGSVPNSFMWPLSKIPDKVFNLFNENGWSMEFGTARLSRYNEAHGTSGVGLCEPDTKSCYAADAGSVIHEMGHALKKVLLSSAGSSDTKLAGIYKREGKTAATFIRAYANTSVDEFFAEVFREYIENHGNKSWNQRFAEKMPESYALMESMYLFEPIAQATAKAAV